MYFMNNKCFVLNLGSYCLLLTYWGIYIIYVLDIQISHTITFNGWPKVAGPICWWLHEKVL